jgi:hypothetical protein
MHDPRSAVPFFGPTLFSSTALIALFLGCLDLCADPGIILQTAFDKRAQWWIVFMVFSFCWFEAGGRLRS